jgi:predicted metal-binding membrane protein
VSRLETSGAQQGEPGVRQAGIRSTRELPLAVALLALSAIAWLTIHHLATPDMRLGILTGAAGPTHSVEAMRPMPMRMPMGAGLFLAMWGVMMAAMMFPAVTPVVVRVSRLMRARGAGDGAAYAMIAGYFLVWCTAGLAAYGLFLALQAVVSVGDVLAVRAGAVILLVAGAYQLTPLKRACLRQCRSPLAVVVRYGEGIVRSRTGALRVGIRHGAYCLGCCWALMAVLLAAGAMSLVWMGAVATVVLVEKIHRHGEALSRLLGSLLIVLALTVVAEPDLLLTLT